MGRPNKPRSPFFRFAHEQISKQQVPTIESAKRSGELWRELPEAKKKVYIKAFEAENLVYKDKLAKWETKMVDSGHSHLVRKRVLIESVLKDALEDSESVKKVKSKK